MECEITSWAIFFHLLLLLLANGSAEARKMSNTVHDHVHRSSNPTVNPPSDLSKSVFFKFDDMKVGKKVKLYFSKEETPTPRLLPRQEADSIPFSSKHIPYLLNLFSFPPDSPQAQEVKSTLALCESAPNKREAKFCATSLESMLDFVLGVFGISEPSSDDHPTMLMSTLRSKDRNSVYQNYTALGAPEEVLSNSRVIGCHIVGYPYPILFCHSQERGDKVYKIPFLGDNGDEYEAFAVCHEDTSDWDPNNASFRALGTKPGSQVCHIFPPYSNLIWIHPHTAASIQL